MNQEKKTINNKLQDIQILLNNINDVKGSISDGFHTFDELYTFRKIYNALVFNEWAKEIKKETVFVKDSNGKLVQKTISEKNKYDVHKSWKHNDGELCFGGGWFIVIAILPTGQISNHYEAKDWDLFKIPEVEKSKYEFDGHTTEDVIERILDLINKM
jgi:hypothetical protein